MNNNGTNHNLDFDFEELISQLQSMLNPSAADSSPLTSAPSVITEAASHDFAQYRFLFSPVLVQTSVEPVGQTTDESRSLEEEAVLSRLRRMMADPSFLSYLRGDDG